MNYQFTDKVFKERNEIVQRCIEYEASEWKILRNRLALKDGLTLNH